MSKKIKPDMCIRCGKNMEYKGDLCARCYVAVAVDRDVYVCTNEDVAVWCEFSPSNCSDEFCEYRVKKEAKDESIEQ